MIDTVSVGCWKYFQMYAITSILKYHLRYITALAERKEWIWKTKRYVTIMNRMSTLRNITLCNNHLRLDVY